MKRHQSLMLLSRDHHQALLLVTRLQQGRNALLTLWSHDPHWQAEHVVKFYDEDLTPHFVAEEQILFPSAEKHISGKTEVLDRLIREHSRLRNHIDFFRNPDAGILEPRLSMFGKLLEEHVRCEEREFFPLCENIIPEEELTDIGRRIAETINRGTRQ